MTLRYFEGFDVHRRLDYGGLIVSDTDAWRNWSTGSLFGFRPFFYTGRNNYGGCMRVNEYSGASKEASINGLSQVRMGMWASGAVRNNVIKISKRFFAFYTPNSGQHISIWANGDGSFQVRGPGNVAYGPPTFEDYLLNDATNDPPLHFNYYELYADSTTGHIQMWRNKILVLDQTIGYLADTFQAFHFGHIPAELAYPYWDPIIDHLWITDGDPLPEEEVIAVSISVAQDTYTSKGRGFRGTLIMNDQRYTTDWLASSTYSPGQFNRNVVTVTPFFFMKDPRNGLPWSEAGLKNVQSWGVCFAPTDANPGGLARIDSLAFTYLTWNDGMPLVKYEIPSTVTSFSGNWIKSHPELSYFAHVNDVPRENILMREDSKSLYTGTVGCILFDRSGTNTPDNPDVDYPIEQFGITFAEEYREDYQDFVKVDGRGTDYLSYAVSGYGVYGEGNRQFQGNYITVNYAPLPNGQAYVQGVWDYSIDKATGRWSMRQQVYFLDDDGHKHFARKVKIRGHGKALQIRIESQSGKAFEINGWTLYVTANQHP